MSTETRRSVEHGSRAVLTFGAALFLGACTFGSMTSDKQASTPPGTDAMWDTPARNANIAPAVAPAVMPNLSTLAMLGAIGWGQDTSPLFTDDQRLHKSDSTYGPWAGIYPSVFLDTMSGFLSGTNGVLVAIAEVIADTSGNPLPPTYTDLRLVEGRNCIYLKQSGGVFEGYVKPAVAAHPYCSATYSDANPLTVTTFTSTTYTGSSSIPAVARFHEGKNSSRAMERAPYFGLKCGAAWCRFHPSTVSPNTPPYVANGPRQIAMPGWADAQHLSTPMTSSGASPSATKASSATNAASLVDGPKVRSENQSAWIVPDTALASFTKDSFAAGHKLVAVVRFANTPRKKYKDRWHFEPYTENEIWIKADNISQNKWSGYMVRRTYFGPIPMPWHTRTPLVVTRTPHAGMVIPATARFKWLEDDEDIWIRCDDGCCKASEGGDG